MERPEERLALIELHERDGHAVRMVDVWQWPLRLGRALDNHVVIDDPHVAAHHAELLLGDNGELLLRALPSHNGTRLDGRLVAQSTPMPAHSALLQLGTSTLRLRRAGETLAPEKLLAARGRRAWLPAAAVATALLLLMLANHWLTLDPGADYTAWVQVLVGLGSLLAAWCGLWALMSKLFQRRFDFNGHLRIALPWALAMALTDALWPQGAASLALPGLWLLAAPLQMLLLALLVHAHLAHVLPLHRRAVTASVAVVTLAGGALSAALTYRASDSFFSAPYMSTLPLPALRLAGTAPSTALVQDMAPVAAQLAQRVKKAKLDDNDDDGDNAD